MTHRAALASLAHAVGVPSSADALDRAERHATTLEAACTGLGLRLVPFSGGAADVPHAVAPGHPLLGRIGTRVAAIVASSSGAVEVRFADEPGPRRLAPELLAGGQFHLVEPVLPASALRGDTPLARLRGLLVAERDDIVGIVIYAVAIGVLALAMPLAIQLSINWLAFGGLLQPIVTLAAILLVLSTLGGTLRALQRYAVELLQRRLFVRMVADLAARVPRVRIGAFDDVHAPVLMNQFFDVLTVQKAMSGLMLDGIAAALQAAVGLVVLALYHPTLAVFDLFVIAAMAAVLFGLGRGATATAIQASKKKYAVAGFIEELARHPLLFKFGGTAQASRRAETLSMAYLDARDDHFRVFFRQFVGAQAVQVVVSAALLLACGWLLLEGEITLGQLVAAEFIVASALAGFTKFTDKLESVYDLLAGVDKLGALVDLPPERFDGIATADGPAMALRVEGLAGDTPGGSVAPTSFAIEAGGRLALHAPHPQALADLLVGLRPASAGAVWLDGAELRDWRPQAVFDQVALLRSGEAFAGTVLENLTLGAPIAPERAWDALRAVGLAERVAGLDGGLDAELGTDGAPLTTTERLQLACARALARSPRLIVVDQVLDGLGDDQRTRLCGALASSPATIAVLTRDPSLPATLPLTPRSEVSVGASVPR